MHAMVHQQLKIVSYMPWSMNWRRRSDDPSLPRRYLVSIYTRSSYECKPRHGLGGLPWTVPNHCLCVDGVASQRGLVWTSCIGYNKASSRSAFASSEHKLRFQSALSTLLTPLHFSSHVSCCTLFASAVGEGAPEDEA